MSTRPDTVLAAARRFLTEYFSDYEIEELCTDYFRDVYNTFATGMTKVQKIRELLDYCSKHSLMPNLLEALRITRPNQFDARFPNTLTTTSGTEETFQLPSYDKRQVFINHAHQDADFAHKLASDLKQHGWSTWIAPESIRPGKKWEDEIFAGLHTSGVFLALLSSHAVQSDWVRHETEIAFYLASQESVRLVPLCLEACDIPKRLTAYHYVSFMEGYEKGLYTLLTELRKHKAQGNSLSAFLDWMHHVPIVFRLIVLVALVVVVITGIALSKGTSAPLENGALSRTPVGTLSLSANATFSAISDATHQAAGPTATTASGSQISEPTALLTVPVSKEQVSVPVSTTTTDLTISPGITETQAQIPSATRSAVESTETPPVNAAATSGPTLTPPPTGVSIKKPTSIMGSLFVTGPAECNISFDIQSSGEKIGSGQVGTRLTVATGSYSLVFSIDFGELQSKQISITAQQEIEVDLSRELGTLQLTAPTNLGNSFVYKVYKNDLGLSSDLDLGAAYCGTPGTYDVVAQEGRYFPIKPCFDPLSGCSRFYRYSLFTRDRLRMGIEIKAGEQSSVSIDPWLRDIGLLSFSRPSISLDIELSSPQTGEQIAYSIESGESYWILAGRYTLTVTAPYVGLVYKDIEAKAGEKVVLELPTDQ